MGVVQLGVVQLGVVQMGIVQLGVVQVQLGSVQMGVVQLGVVQLGVVQMGVDPVAQHIDRSNEKSPILRTQQLVQGVPEKTTFLKLIGSLIKPCCNGCSFF